MSNTLAIQLFLQRLKALVTEGKVVFQPRNRRKSREFMLEHGLTEEDILAVLGSLRPEHYRKGPEADHDGSAGSVYVFVCPYEQFRLYVKAKIIVNRDGDLGVVLSFHPEGMHD